MNKHLIGNDGDNLTSKALLCVVYGWIDSERYPRALTSQIPEEEAIETIRVYKHVVSHADVAVKYNRLAAIDSLGAKRFDQSFVN